MCVFVIAATSVPTRKTDTYPSDEQNLIFEIDGVCNSVPISDAVKYLWSSTATDSITAKSRGDNSGDALHHTDRHHQTA